MNDIKETFELWYKQLFKREFIWDDLSTKIYYTLLLYFLQEERFYKSPFITQQSKPDLNKGLLIVGDYGIGKSSIFKALHVTLSRSNNLKLNYYTTNEVVNNYKECVKSSHEILKGFWDRHNKLPAVYDDLFNERPVVDYGERIDVMGTVLFNRAEINAKTFCIMNYQTENKSLSEALKAVSGRYGLRVYDRFFQMFNILEINGQSKRV